MKLIIATRNAHKLKEIREMLNAPDVEVFSALDFAQVPEVEEDGETFEANAIKKARTLAAATGYWSLADDSGLEVDALEGAPGVYSARYAGEPVDYQANNRKLLREMKDVAHRGARFRCVMALASPDGEVRTVEGRCEGMIALGEKGTRGFGYDPLFIPEGESRTFAEMPDAAKNAISHRGRALMAARKTWRHLLSL